MTMIYNNLSNKNTAITCRTGLARGLKTALIFLLLIPLSCGSEEATVPAFDFDYFTLYGPGGQFQFKFSLFTDLTPITDKPEPMLDVYVMGINDHFEGEYPAIIHETIPLSEWVQLWIRDLDTELRFDLIFTGDVEPVKLTNINASNILGLRYVYLFGLPGEIIDRFQVYTKPLPDADELVVTMKQMGFDVKDVRGLGDRNLDVSTWRISIDYGQVPERGLFKELILKKDIEDIILPRVVAFE